MAASHQEPSTRFAAVQRTLGLVLMTLACAAGAEVLETLYHDSVAVADRPRSGASRAARQGVGAGRARVSGPRACRHPGGVREPRARAGELLGAYHSARNGPSPGEGGEAREDALPVGVQLSARES